MNDQESTTSAPDLPDLPQTSIERIENEVFAAIAADRLPSLDTRSAAASSMGQRRRARRRRWLTGIGVAAAFVAGVLITPPLLNLATVTTEGASSASDTPAGGDVDRAAPDISSDAVSGDAAEPAAREVVTSASATLRVEDIDDAADSVSAIAEQHGGYVESTDIVAENAATDAHTPVERGEHGWVSIRVPSADLTTVVQELGDIGRVLSSSTSRQDVTSAAIDLRARVEATQASVDRLSELMSQSGTVSELIEAELALTDRQAQLESYTQQLAALEDQVAMSSLNVELAKEQTATSAEPDRFAEGLLAGWNGLIISLNVLVIAVGFLLPWLLVAGFIVLVIWFVRRSRRRRRDASHTP